VAIVTTLAVYRFPPEGGEAYLASVHPGRTVDQVRAETGWELKVSDAVAETVPPSALELEMIRRFDPEGFWTGRR
jgi:glutaconate CoA-transferase subunit B